jgi:hypothetical protein
MQENQGRIPQCYGADASTSRSPIELEHPFHPNNIGVGENSSILGAPATPGAALAGVAQPRAASTPHNAARLTAERRVALVPHCDTSTEFIEQPYATALWGPSANSSFHHPEVLAGMPVRHYPAKLPDRVKIGLVLEERTTLESAALPDLNKWQHRRCATCGTTQVRLLVG